MSKDQTLASVVAKLNKEKITGNRKKKRVSLVKLQLKRMKRRKDVGSVQDQQRQQQMNQQMPEQQYGYQQQPDQPGQPPHMQQGPHQPQQMGQTQNQQMVPNQNQQPNQPPNPQLPQNQQLPLNLNQAPLYPGQQQQFQQNEFGHNSLPNNTQLGDNNNNSNLLPNNGPLEYTKNLAVPKEYVGVVIGRHGGNIRTLQKETGCKVQFSTGPCLILHGTQEACEKAESNVKDMLGMVIQKDPRLGGPNTQTVEYQKVPSKSNAKDRLGKKDVKIGGRNTQTVEYQVPANKCGLVIGRGGRSIRQMKEQSGAHIEMNKHAPHDAPTKVFTLSGTQQQIEAAQKLIAECIVEYLMPS